MKIREHIKTGLKIKVDAVRMSGDQYCNIPISECKTDSCGLYWDDDDCFGRAVRARPEVAICGKNAYNLSIEAQLEKIDGIYYVVQYKAQYIEI